MHSLHAGLFTMNTTRIDNPRRYRPARMARWMTTVYSAFDGGLLFELAEELASLLAEDTLESPNFGPLVLTRHGSVLEMKVRKRQPYRERGSFVREGRTTDDANERGGKSQKDWGASTIFFCHGAKQVEVRSCCKGKGEQSSSYSYAFSSSENAGRRSRTPNHQAAPRRLQTLGVSRAFATADLPAILRCSFQFLDFFACFDADAENPAFTERVCIDQRRVGVQRLVHRSHRPGNR